MSYSISFKVKVEGIDCYVEVGACDATTTWNVREMIRQATGLEWINCANNGFCNDVIPHIRHGYNELCSYPEKYEPYEASNGWGTVESTRKFFKDILDAWDDFNRWNISDLIDVTTFWIE